ncbi:MAG: Fis family two component sigma-54 specific transcriptional regulator, partial [Microgenomates group bacterium Gr01-1014_93]
MDNKKKILIVEDDQFLREFYEELLQGEGYSVDAAADGDQGLTKISQGGYDLILLDIMLPKKDGMQILRELRVKPPAEFNG